MTETATAENLGVTTPPGFAESPLMEPYAEILAFVQHLVPTWRRTQQAPLAQLIAALLQRPSLCLTDPARALAGPEQPLLGRSSA